LLSSQSAQTTNKAIRGGFQISGRRKYRSKIAGLMVISRNSSFTYKGRSVDIRAIGRELSVRSVRDRRACRPNATTAT
jgi:hypothetical protein